MPRPRLQDQQPRGPEELQRLQAAQALGQPVQAQPVQDTQAVVRAFSPEGEGRGFFLVLAVPLLQCTSHWFNSLE